MKPWLEHRLWCLGGAPLLVRRGTVVGAPEGHRRRATEGYRPRAPKGTLLLQFKIRAGRLCLESIIRTTEMKHCFRFTGFCLGFTQKQRMVYFIPFLCFLVVIHKICAFRMRTELVYSYLMI